MTLKRTWHIILKILKGFALTVLIYFGLALLFSFIPVNSGFVQAQSGIPVYVISNGVHTDIVIPLKTTVYDWSRQLPYQDYKGADSTFTHLALGWGDRNFYMNTPEWKDLTLTVALDALFTPSASAMHVYYLRRSPLPGSDCRQVLLTPEQYQNLTRFFLRSFSLDKSGHTILIPNKGYGKLDNFYEAGEKFYIGKTCNTWTGRALRAAGVKTGLWTPFPFSVMKHLPEPEKK